MYVEISPRQSGKTTRLVTALVDYLRANIGNNHYVALVVPNSGMRGDLLRTIRDRLALMCAHDFGMEWPTEGIYNIIDNYHMKHIITKTRFGEYNNEPNMWFFDEFSFMSLDRILHPIHRNVITNGYYSTSPSSFDTSLRVIVDYCRENDININFHNPWTPTRLREQGGLEPYIRNHVLGDWEVFMTANGFDIGDLKPLLMRYIKKHSFINGR